MEDYNVKEGKTLAVVSYITIIGTLIAFILNQNKRNSFTAYHIRQAIGVFLTGLIVSFLQKYSHFSWVDVILGFGVFLLWAFGIIAAIQGKEKPVPVLGEKFEEWFRNIG